MTSIKNNISFLVGLISLAISLTLSAQTYVGKSIGINIFSSTPIEDIKAASKTGVAVLSSQNQEITIQVAIKSLEFDKKMMQEHFNENYMESDKYPLAKFKGIIEPKIDWTKDGVYEVTAKGILSIHGVDQQRNINGKISIKNGAASLSTEFNVACAAHQIKIPSLVFTKIAEVIKVSLQGQLTLLK